MFKYLAKRAALYAVLIFVTTSFAYLLASTFFQPGQLMEAQVPRPTQEQIDNQLRVLGLDPHLSAWERYIQWLRGVVFHWDWGRTPTGAFVNQEFGDRVWVSARLLLASTILTMIIGVALGVYSGIRQYSVGDRLFTGFSYLVFIVPTPVAYLLTQFFFIDINEALGQQLFYVTGSASIDVEGFWPTVEDQLRRYIAPTTALTIMGWAGYQVAMRQFLLDNVDADYVRTARATGLTRAQAIRKHALRVSAIPVAQSVAYSVPAIFTGAFFAETIFNWSGVGQWGLLAIHGHDVNSTVALMTFGSVLTAVSFILADFVTVIVDPRVRL
ncbi:ABC transporter permease [Falsarthrobacter nasiphocae]|uniref:Peptide/nickel transport system permease protein n=1 Tax=Falsarthrobacter nasiphocae TaxID=189863 RepID=A0AAE3YFH6_9MICC|nr:ABC transporter permease [Falsarthrobacter nasiphocae]MDR6892469.1 peptide/nickel transport system permease protein [Falsarthrobacter nasiphocae]